MLQQDYLMKMVSQLVEAIRRSWSRAKDEGHPSQAAGMLDDAVGQALEMDADALLCLAPDSFAGILLATGADPRVTEYIARTLLLCASYLEEAGESSLAGLRRDQAHALAGQFGFEIPQILEEVTPESVTSDLLLS